jgi:hypothetical protein
VSVPSFAQADSIFSRTWKAVLLAGLATYLLMQGVMPALTAISSDFPEYFTSATIVRSGEDPVKLYDGAWFRDQTRRYEVGPPENPGSFSPYPPPTALLLTPLTGFAPLTALRIVTVLNLLWVACAVFLLRKIFAWRLLDSALFILLSGWALHSGLRFGHPYILISTSCLLAWHLYRKRMPFLAGVCLGVFIPVKYYPAIFLAAFALRGQWRVVLGGGLAVATVALISIGALGWQVHQIFLFDVLWDHLTGHLNNGPSFAVQFQSFDSLFSRLFIFDAARNPHPLLQAPLARTIAIITIKASLVLATAVALTKQARGTPANPIGPTIGILGILGLLLAPGSGSYALVLLWLPVALLVDFFLSQGTRAPAYLILGLYGIIGYIPYGHTTPFDGRGVLTVLAYPRLFLLLAMFVVGICAIVRPRSLEQRALPLAA